MKLHIQKSILVDLHKNKILLKNSYFVAENDYIFNSVELRARLIHWK